VEVLGFVSRESLSLDELSPEIFRLVAALNGLVGDLRFSTVSRFQVVGRQAARTMEGSAMRTVPVALASFLVFSLDCSDTSGPANPVRKKPHLDQSPSAAAAAVLVGAGDIALCNGTGDEETARILDGIAGTVFTIGDNAYPDGTAQQFTSCYQPSWGRHKARTKPTPGNHDYHQAGAAPYYRYFGAAAGDPGKGYYSYDVGSWHIIALNSEVDAGAGGAQVAWLKRDLAAHSNSCVLAYWHNPRFSSGSTHGTNSKTQPFWQALYDANADVVVSAHDHDYERFAPQTPTGAADSRRGIREFIVGTGGAGVRGFGTIRPNSEKRIGMQHGVIRLSLNSGSYAWTFIATGGRGTLDSGSGSCH
jgi:hypothetical protein